MTEQGVLKLILRNFSFRFSADVINRLLIAVAGIFLANYLGAVDNGRYNLVYSYLFIAAVLCELGLAPIVMRELSKSDIVQGSHDEAHILGNAFLLKLIFSGITFVIGGGIALLLPSLMSIQNLILIALLSLFFNWGSMFGAAFEAKLRLEYPALIQVGSGLLFTGLVFTLIYLKAPIWAFIVIRTVIAIPETLVYVKCLKLFVPVRITFSRRISLYLLKESAPLLASQICIVLYLRIDQLMLNSYLGEQPVGVYAAAVNLVEPLWIFAIAFMTVMAPLLARVFVQNTKQYIQLYHDCFRIVNGVAWPLAFGGTVLAQVLIAFVYQPEFEGAFLSFTLLLWGNIFNYLGIVNNKLLIISGKQSLDFVFTGSSLFVNLILNILLIPEYGITGAALASVVAYATGPVLGYFLKATRAYSRAMLVTAVRPGAAALIMAAVVYQFRDSILVTILLGTMSYFLLLWLFGGISARDWELMKSLRTKQE